MKIPQAEVNEREQNEGHEWQERQRGQAASGEGRDVGAGCMKVLPEVEGFS